MTSITQSRTPAGRTHPHRAADRLVQHIVSGWRCQAIHAAVQLGVTDALADSACTSDELATQLDCDPDGLARLLRALCTLGLAKSKPDGRFALTPMGRLLCSRQDDGSPGLRALALWWGGPLWSLWGELSFSVKTGRSARQKQTGEAGYGYLEQDRALPAVFHDAQCAMTALVLDDLARWPGWRGVRTLVDVGGGHGQLALGMLKSHRALQAVVLDQAHAEPGARQAIGAAGLAGRCSFKAGSFMDRIPSGADVYILKSILHNWNDAASARILQCCAQAVPPHGKLLLIERVQPVRLRTNSRDQAVTRTDLNMLAGLGGRERTEAQYGALLAAAGFTIGQTQPLSFEFALIEARPASTR